MSAPPIDSLESMTDAQVLDEWRSIEAARRGLEVREVAVIAQVEQRKLAFDHGCKNIVDFARALLRIGARDAAGRVKLAGSVGARHTLTGEAIEPAHPLTAAALASGEISARAAWTVVDTVDRLAPELVEGAPVAVETVLLDFAREHDPDTLARHARAVRDALDQDGQYSDLDRRHRRREVDLRRHPDGSGSLSGQVTCELAEYLATLFDTLAKPEPTNPEADTGPTAEGDAAAGKPESGQNGERDLRTPAQRRHDALLTAMKLLFQTGRLPTTGGCATTLLLTMDADTLATGAGAATTGHGYAIPAEVAKSWLDPEARAILVLLSSTKGITAYSSTQRLFTEQQRLAMAARDHGCSYWGCDAPTSWTQAHHVQDYQHTRRTRVDDGALVCTGNHATFEAMGWQSIMLNGRPHWVPPSWIDPERTPRRNHLHD